MNVAEIGEFGLIRLLADLVQRNNHPASDRNLLLGIGDDTAVWKSQGEFQLATTDCLIQDIHFDIKYITWSELGHKSIAINLSDIAAMGGTPQYALISLSLPGDIAVDNAVTLYQGIVDISNKYNVHIIGGNVSMADKLQISVTVHGFSTGKHLLLRSAAKPGDQIAITGYTGLAGAGLQMLSNQLNIEGEAASLFRRAHLQPEPRIKEGQMLIKHGIEAAIDISDGILSDLKHICEASKVSATIRSELVPIHPLLKKYFKEDAIELALTGGEDYELLFTATPKDIQNIRREIATSITVIGEIGILPSGNVSIVDVYGKDMVFRKAGWDHFKSKD